MAGMESKVLETLTESTGSLRKTSVRPFCLEKTRMMMPDNWKEESRRNIGTVNGTSAARIPLDVNEGEIRLRVLSGLA